MHDLSQLELFREDFRLRERQSPKARHIRIEVRPGREVVLIYPRWVPRSEALSFLHAKQDWIRGKLAELAGSPDAQPPVPQRWDGRDEILLRGHRLPVRIEPARLRRASVRIDDAAISIFAPVEQRDDARKLDAALRGALLHQARLDALRYLESEAARLRVRYAELRLHDPRTLWGSCNPGGVICLSWRLVMGPPEVFRYVVVHELCHLVHLDHSERFWRLVAQQMPDFETHKHWLRDHGHELHRHLVRKAA